MFVTICRALRSSSKVKVKVKGQDQISGALVDIRRLDSQVKQKAITIQFWTNNDHYQSKEFVSVSVISELVSVSAITALIGIISRAKSISC